MINFSLYSKLLRRIHSSLSPQVLPTPTTANIPLGQGDSALALPGRIRKKREREVDRSLQVETYFFLDQRQVTGVSRRVTNEVLSRSCLKRVAYVTTNSLMQSERRI